MTASVFRPPPRLCLAISDSGSLHPQIEQSPALPIRQLGSAALGPDNSGQFRPRSRFLRARGDSRSAHAFRRSRGFAVQDRPARCVGTCNDSSTYRTARLRRPAGSIRPNPPAVRRQACDSRQASELSADTSPRRSRGRVLCKPEHTDMGAWSLNKSPSGKAGAVQPPPSAALQRTSDKT